MGLLCRLFILVAMVTLTSAAPLEEIERVLEDLLLLEELKSIFEIYEVPESISTLFNEMKKGTKKWCIFKIQDGKVVLDEFMPGDESLADDKDETAWNQMTPKLLGDPRYVLYEINFHNHEGESIRKIIFMLWSPDEGAKANDKMKYSGTKKAFENACTGLKFKFQANDIDDLAYQPIKEEVEKKA